jgi:hypothetical protein
MDCFASLAMTERIVGINARRTPRLQTITALIAATGSGGKLASIFAAAATGTVRATSRSRSRTVCRSTNLTAMPLGSRRTTQAPTVSGMPVNAMNLLPLSAEQRTWPDLRLARPGSE